MGKIITINAGTAKGLAKLSVYPKPKRLGTIIRGSSLQK